MFRMTRSNKMQVKFTLKYMKDSFTKYEDWGLPWWHSPQCRTHGLGLWYNFTCWGATKPMHHKYWTYALEPESHNYLVRVLQVLKPMHLQPVLHNRGSHCNEKPMCHATKSGPCSSQWQKAWVKQPSLSGIKNKFLKIQGLNKIDMSV